ncbi:hypothetical protein C3F34_14135 [Acinetobacter sp. ACNIH2]|uniref:hypothetical protein n=1 Tax=Acinetobacter sp. ACNIH2 TaxID=1758189 RepID=UPI000CDC1C12|nr:hypothetical protein [Acinetobacter sp. ACNIH2]AUX87062.1 hypothetical protein C3F34_14135 [Acinetobacter sp. ACNIH2]
MINYELIFEELHAMQPKGVKFFKDHTSQEFEELNNFLEDNQFELGIEIKPHRESQTGHRAIDAILVKKL